MATPSSVKVIAVTSGKGGVGKTNVSVNLAVSMANSGRSVLLFDADLGLANIDIALGLKPRFDIRHVISGERSLEEILIEGPSGVQIVPASSGVARLAALSQSERAGLIKAFSELSMRVDALIVDTGAGIDPTVLNFSSACQDIIVVLCDEPTSITDAYALIKVLNKDCGVKSFQILANMVDDDAQGRQLYGKISRVTDQFLDVHLGFIGSVPRDDFVRKAIQRQKAVISAYPRSKASKALADIANKVDSSFSSQASLGGLGFFVERLIQYDDLAVKAGA